jgi:hypothetical protein
MCWLAWSNEIAIFMTNAKLGMHLLTFREESWAGQKHTSLSDQLKKTSKPPRSTWCQWMN